MQFCLGTFFNFHIPERAWIDFHIFAQVLQRVMTIVTFFFFAWMANLLASMPQCLSGTNSFIEELILVDKGGKHENIRAASPVHHNRAADKKG